MTSRVIARPFSLQERAITSKLHEEYLQHYESNPQDARKLLGVGESRPSAGVDAVELAALTMVANSILNLDEALTK
jgi:hypothetical protein